MNEQTANLHLPYIMPSQAQKHVTCNETFRILDALVQLCVLDRETKEPPFFPEEGSRYIVPEGAMDVWSDHANHIAAWQDEAWSFYAPLPGWSAFVQNQNEFVVFDGVSWVSKSTARMEMLGINADADSVNRLNLRSEASLFDHTGEGHQHKINKATPDDTASLLFQSNYTGYAEIGLTGDNKLRMKLSKDGQVWQDALVCDPEASNIQIGTAENRSYVEILGFLGLPRIQGSSLARPSLLPAGVMVYMTDKNAVSGSLLISDGKTWREVVTKRFVELHKEKPGSGEGT